MNNTLLKQRIISLAAGALLSLLAACATTASPRAESALLSAGFTAKVATTAKQRQELQTLPEGRISSVTRNEKTFYISPDAPNNRLYVGNKAQYETYKRLTTPLRDSSGPVMRQPIIRGGIKIPVETFYDWPPFGNENPR
jgi:hypothetical protein